MRVLLVNPSYGGAVRAGRHNRPWPPLDLLNAAAILRAEGHDVSLLDGRAEDLAPPRRLGGAHDRVVLTTSPLDRWQCPNLDLSPALSWARAAPPEKLIVSGAHGTVFPEAVLSETGARFVVRGEPEAALPGLLRALSEGREGAATLPGVSGWVPGGFVHGPDAAPPDLSAIPPPAYDLVCPAPYRYEPLGGPLAVLETARGCPHRCSFCFKAVTGSKVREKAPERVAGEVEAVLSRGFRAVYFLDPEFTLRRERVRALCAEFRRLRFSWCCQARTDSVDPETLREMAGAGCCLIHFGVESADAGVLRAARKGTGAEAAGRAVSWARGAGMATAAFFLFGLPGETPESGRATLDLAMRLNVTYPSFHTVAPYAGTPLAEALGVTAPWWHAPPPVARHHRRYLRYALRPAWAREFFARGAGFLPAARLLWRMARGGG